MDALLAVPYSPIRTAVVSQCPVPQYTPRDDVNFTSSGFGHAWPQFDFVGQSQGQLLPADNSSMPGGFPTNFLSLQSYLGALFPGTTIPTDSLGLEHLASKLQSDQGTTPLDLLDMIQDMEHQPSQSEDAITTPFPDDAHSEQPLLPIFVNAFSYTENGREVPVSSIMVGPDGQDLPAAGRSDGNKADIANMTFLGREDERYDIDVTWQNGASFDQACDGGTAASALVDIYLPW